jgi:hypothetical protein
LVNNSLRFRSSASAYLNRTQGAGNRKIFTLSAWVKRGSLGSYNPLFTGQNDLANSDWDTLEFNSSDVLRFYLNGATSGYFVTTQVFRDPSAWYHIVVAVDTTQATSTNRVKIYVNGSQITSFTTATYPSQNFDCWINKSGRVAALGANYYSAPTGYFDGYMAEINFIDGQQLTPNSFGTFNSYGVWQPITYGGSYGTNGFYLPFTNTTSTTTLGYDFSPNGNNWTANNISVATSTSIQTFSTTGTTAWVAPVGVTSVTYLVVAGGGGGGSANISTGRTRSGGGGGAGGLLTGTLSVTAGTSYTVTVGTGGTGSTNEAVKGTNGGDSVFSSITSTGGGGGGSSQVEAGVAGGSGGGGATTDVAGAGTSGQGNAGAAGGPNSGSFYGGGGGGAGGAGSSTSAGSGSASSISGSSVTYATGGGGGSTGGRGSTSSGYGMGGGGGGYNTGARTGDNGTAGVVILSYTLPTSSSYDSMTDVPTLTSATAANYAVSNVLDIDRANITTSNGNLTLTKATASDSPRAACTFGATSGKFYAEITWTSVTNTTPNDNYIITGVTTKENWTDSSNGYNNIYYIGANNGLAIAGNKGGFTAGSFNGYATYGSNYFASGSVIGIALNLDAGTVTFYNNGVSQGAITLPTTTQPWFFYNTSDGTSNGYTANWNFGQQPFVYTPPTGYVRLNTYNL